MPLIPLIQASRPIADAPAPVLNRERQPTVNDGGVMAAIGGAASASKMPTMATDALSAPARALGAVGGAIMQAGNVVGALAIKTRQAESDVQVAKADAQMQQASADFEQWKIDTNADPATWGAEWQKRLGGLNETLAQADMHDGAREQVKLRMIRFGGQSQAQVTAGAAKETFARAKSAFAATIERGINSQDPATFEEAIKTGEERGYFFPHEIEGYRQKFTVEGERMKRKEEADAMEAAQDRVIANAEGPGVEDTLARIDSGEMGNYSPADRERLRSVAKQVGASRSAESVGTLIDGIASGEITSVQRIDELAMGNPHLSGRTLDEVKRYLATRDDLQEKLYRDTVVDGVSNGVRDAVRLRKEIQAYDPAQDPDRSQYAALSQEIAAKADRGMVNELSSDLGRKYGLQPKGELRPEVQRMVTKQLGAMFDPEQGAIPWRKKEFQIQKYQADQSSWFGPDRKKGEAVIDPKTGQPTILTDKNGEQKFKWTTDLAAKERAIQAEAAVEEKMRQWSLLNPDKANDLGEVMKALRTFIPAGTRGGALKEMQGSMPNPGALFDVNPTLTLPTK